MEYLLQEQDTPPAVLGWYWVQRDESEPVIVRLEVNEDGRRVVAYDGHRVLLHTIVTQTDPLRWCGPLFVPPVGKAPGANAADHRSQRS